MPAERGAALRRLRGEASVRAFSELLAGHGLGKGALSRHRLAAVESGAAELPDAMWDAIAHALIDAGYGLDAVAVLWSAGPPVEPPPSPRRRLEQWRPVVGQVGDNHWWARPLDLVTRATGAVNLPRYQRILARYGGESRRQLALVRDRLELGASGAWQASPDDGVAIDRARSELTVRVGRAELFLSRLRLHNTGVVGWRDRLLYRVGAPVTTGTPFTPGVLPVPDIDPGGDCEVLVPGRAQWFPSLAAIHFVMVFPDGTPCLPGRVCCWVDARTGELDRSLRLLSEKDT